LHIRRIAHAARSTSCGSLFDGGCGGCALRGQLGGQHCPHFSQDALLYAIRHIARHSLLREPLLEEVKQPLFFRGGRQIRSLGPEGRSHFRQGALFHPIRQIARHRWLRHQTMEKIEQFAFFWSSR
jgi:hypothetical protein